MKYNPITVTDLNKYIKEKISDDEYLNSVLVKGKYQILKDITQGIYILR